MNYRRKERIQPCHYSDAGQPREPVTCQTATPVKSRHANQLHHGTPRLASPRHLKRPTFKPRHATPRHTTPDMPATLPARRLREEFPTLFESHATHANLAIHASHATPRHAMPRHAMPTNMPATPCQTCEQPASRHATPRLKNTRRIPLFVTENNRLEKEKMT